MRRERSISCPLEQKTVLTISVDPVPESGVRVALQRGSWGAVRPARVLPATALCLVWAFPSHFMLEEIALGRGNTCSSRIDSQQTVCTAVYATAVEHRASPRGVSG